MNRVDKGKGGSSEDDNYGFNEVKKKKSGGKNRGTKNSKLASVKPKTKYRPKVNQSTEEVSPKTALSVGKKNVLTSGNSSKKTRKLIGGIRLRCMVCKRKSKVLPFSRKINMFEEQLLDGKCVHMDDDGKPLEKVDYSGDHGSEDEVEPVDNEMTSYLASKPSGVGYGTNSLLKQ
nr:hypothetical protein [Tanacetum cinerariifolium]